MYDIQRIKSEDYVDCYTYKSRNECNQILVCEIYRTIEGYLNVTFYVTTKRKQGFQFKKSTGKDGIKSLMWAKKCLLDFIEFARRVKKYKGQTLIVYPDDNRRRRVYERALIPIGFRIVKDRYKSLYLKL